MPFMQKDLPLGEPGGVHGDLDDWQLAGYVRLAGRVHSEAVGEPAEGEVLADL